MEEQPQKQPMSQPEKPKKKFYKYFGLIFILFGFIYYLILPFIFIFIDPSPDRYHCPSKFTEFSENIFTPPISLIILVILFIITLTISILRYLPKYKNNPSIIFIYRRINFIVFILFVIFYFIAMFTAVPMEFLPAVGWVSPC